MVHALQHAQTALLVQSSSPRYLRSTHISYTDPSSIANPPTCLLSGGQAHTTATFFTALDDIAVFDPANVAVTPGESSLFRHIRLWLESTLRRTPVPLYQKQLEVATQMLADPLDYQLSAVKLALSDERL